MQAQFTIYTRRHRLATASLS